MMNQQRIDWPDYIKGIAIILVVIGHVLRGLDKHILSYSPLVHYIDNWIYSFHMPAFFFVSGLFAHRSASRTMLEFIGSKARVIMYPYFVWSTIQTIIMLNLSGMTSHKVSWINLFTIVYKPVMQYWFLYVLFLILMIFIILYKLKLPSWIIFFFSIVIYIAPCFVSLGPWGVMYMLSANMIYFGFGLVLSKFLLEKLTEISTKLLGTGTIIFIVLQSLLVKLNLYLNFNVSLIAALAGIGWLVMISEVLGRYGYAKFLRKYGILSLQIFVAHTIASAGVRIIFQKIFGLDCVLLHLCFGISAGIYFPIVLSRLGKKSKFPYLFSLPAIRITNNQKAKI